MIKIIIFIFTICLYGCNIGSNKTKIVDVQFPVKQNLSNNAAYLSANYYISKGDAYTASKILNSNTSQLKFLELKFISNLMSGNFEYANKISDLLSKIDKNRPDFELVRLVIAIDNNNLEYSLQVGKKIKNFLNFDNITHLIEFWLLILKTSNELNVKNISENISIYKLLILENFYEAKKLKGIADSNFKNKNLTNNDLLLLAGYYFRLNDIKKFKTIILERLPNQFDKDFLIKNFATTRNIFNKIPNLKTILASKIYNNVNIDSLEEYSYPYIKILLEMVLFLCPDMDIAKYSLAEIYNDQKSEHIALEKLNSISSQSFYYLPSNLKKFSILKSLKLEQQYKEHLFKNKKIWPNNLFIMLNLAEYERSQKNYYEAIKIYKNIIKEHGDSDQIFFLYASSLDKVGKWNEAQKILMNILKKSPKNTYTLNYLAYSLALRNEELTLAQNFIKKALSLDPNNGFFLDTLGWVEYKRKDFNSSVFYLEQSIILLPNSSEVMDHLADCYLMLGRTNEAVYEWKKALKHENDINVINLIKAKLRKYE
ncbi:tetratricopeptide repeat protein [Alphaproteobacteria bacterium]|nr:tetratricopeptide repeat protein [Alphaproteobacteria bacterium]